MARFCSLMTDAGCAGLPAAILWLWLGGIAVVGGASVVHYVLARGERDELRNRVKAQLELAEPDDLR